MSPSKTGLLLLLLAFALALAAAATALPARPYRRSGPGGVIQIPPILTDAAAPPPESMARPDRRSGPGEVIQIPPILPDAPAPPASRPPTRSGGIIPLPRVLPDPPSLSRAAPPAPVPEPRECMPSLAGLVSCIDYLNDNRVRAPMAACCGDFRKLVDEAPVCLCHATDGGDVNQMMPEPINVGRLMTALPVACNVPLPMNTLAKCYTELVPPLTTVPSTNH